MIIRVSTVFIVSCAWLVCACGSSTVPAPPQGSSGGVATPPPPPPPPMALVRVIHASPDSLAQTVSAYMDNGTTPVIPELTYRAAAGYTPVPAGSHTVQARLPGMAPTAPPVLQWNTPDLVAGRAYTIIAHGVASDLTGPQVTFAHNEDQLSVAAPGRAMLRFFHGLVGGGVVDVCLGGTTPAFAAVDYGTFGTAHGVPGNYVASSVGAVTVTFRANVARAPAPCTGRIVGSVALQLADNTTSLLVAVGRITRGPMAVTPEVLVCSESPPAASTCVPMSVTPGR